MLKHFIYSSSSKSTTSPLCSTYYRYSSELSSFFCILSFLVKATSIDQTFYSATHYLAAVWLDSRHDLNTNQLLIQNSNYIYKVLIKNLVNDNDIQHELLFIVEFIFYVKLHD